jgi:hypothetical protein
MWGWSCAQNTREQIYHDVVDYALLCRLQVSYSCSVSRIYKTNPYFRTGALSAPSLKSSSKSSCF